LKKLENRQYFEAIRESREKFSSSNSELISLCKLICLYISYINDHENRKDVKLDSNNEINDENEWKITEILINQFCDQNYL
jgi:hypothetical protein